MYDYLTDSLAVEYAADCGRLGISKWTMRTYIDRAREKVKEITS